VQFAVGTVIGPWTLVAPLGEGGNAEVWKATREGAAGPLALKLLLDRRPYAVPYQRFRREIETLERVGPHPGVLRIVAHSLPAQPSKSDRAWLAMPIAEPLAAALAGQRLEAVVEAVRGIASTLVDLNQRFGLAHRDIKPGNLYRYGGRAAVGDFGLVDVPDAETLTEPDRIVGPANFVAYEMMVNADIADGHLADVYSLTKSLWVLATGNVWAPPGHQPASDHKHSIGAYRAHPRAAALDDIVDRCTRDVAARPAMATLASDLSVWLEGPQMTTPADLDLSELAARLKREMAPTTAESQLAEEREDAARAAAERLAALIHPMFGQLEHQVVEAEIGVVDERLERLLAWRAGVGLPGIVAEWNVGARIVGPPPRPLVYRIGAGVTLLTNHQLYVSAAVQVSRDGLVGAGYVGRIPSRTVEVGAYATDSVLQAVADGLHRELVPSLEAFIEGLERRESR
jgi:Protein kinase domain